MRIGHDTEWLDGGTDITFPGGDQEPGLGSAGGLLQLMAKLTEGRVSLTGEKCEVRAGV